MAAQSTSPGLPSAHILPTDSYNSLFDEEFCKYLLDEDTNPLLKLSKESKDLQKQIEEQKILISNYEKTCETIVRHQENFLHKSGTLPKTNTRSVGVYVNIPQEGKLNTTKSVTISMSSPKLAEKKVQQTPIKQPAQKRSVDVVDLTLEEDKSHAKMVKTSESNANKQVVSTSTFAMKHNNVNVTNIPVVSTMQPVLKMGSPPIPFSSTNSFPTSYVNTTSGIRHAYVLSHNPSLNLQAVTVNDAPRFAVGNIRNGRTVFLTTARPPGHVITGQATITNFPPPMNIRHPLPLPEQPPFSLHASEGKPPPKPILKISNPSSGIVLSWNMTITPLHAAIKNYQIYGYEEGANAVDSTIWKRVGEVKALPLPMACTLTQFGDGRRYHFAIRAMDIYFRIGPFSDVNSISLFPKEGGKK